MIVHEFTDDEDDDILLLCNQFNEHHDLDAHQLQSLAAFNFRLIRENHDYLREVRLTEVSIDSNTEFDYPSNGVIEEENLEDIITVVCVQSDPELETQQDDLSRGLDDAQYDTEEEEDILRRLESDTEEFKTEHNGNKEDEDILRQLELETQQNDNKEVDEEEELLLRLNEPFMEMVRQFANKANKLKKEQKELHICSNCHQRLPGGESDIEIKQRMDEEASQPPDNIKEAEDPLTQFMESVPEAGVNEQRDLQGDLKDRLKQKLMTTTEKVDPFDLDTLLDLEEIGLEFYISIEHIISMLKDTEKVRLEVKFKLKFVKTVNDLLQTSSKTVNKLIEELERKKKDETQKIPEILVQLMEFNAELVERSFHHGIGFAFDNNKCTKTELSGYVKGLNRSRENLEIILKRIKELMNAKVLKDKSG